MADKVEEEERRSVAQAEVNAELGGDALESEFLRLEEGPAGVNLEDQLLALKVEMGLIEAPAAQEPKQLEAGEAELNVSETAPHELDTREVSAVEDESIPEAELLSEFDKLEKSTED